MYAVIGVLGSWHPECQSPGPNIFPTLRYRQLAHLLSSVDTDKRRPVLINSGRSSSTGGGGDGTTQCFDGDIIANHQDDFQLRTSEDLPLCNKCGGPLIAIETGHESWQPHACRACIMRI